MQSKTSFFNKTVLKKNLTRFAPVWVVYTLGICAYFLMFYFDEVSTNEYNKLLGFAFNFSWGMIEVFMFWNMAYALLTAQLLFGDLFNSRMCNALHAMPLRRENWFATNCLTGLIFSVIPTFIATLVVLPMMQASIVENAWVIALLWFLATNLQFICCFGMAAFAAMCVGSRLTMAAGYGLLHFGAYMVFWLVNTVYTPMLYGVKTPTTLVTNLTPSAQMIEYRYFDIPSMIYEHEMRGMGITVQELADMTIPFVLTEHWWRIFAIGGAGLLFAGLALVLYRKRDLECAGDAVAFPILKPVFQVLCSLFVMCAGQFLVTTFLGLQGYSTLVMALGLGAGWFVGKMMIERSTRVFRLKNWYGLAVLAACMALTLVATHFDILNIEGRIPDKDKIETIQFSTNQTTRFEVDESQWDNVLRIHELAVEDRVDGMGLYFIQDDGSRVRYEGGFSTGDAYAFDTTSYQQPTNIESILGYDEYVRTGSIRITYRFRDGSQMERHYDIWTDGEIGDLTRKTLSNWEALTMDKVKVDGESVGVLDAVLDDFWRMSVTGFAHNVMPKLDGKEDALSFLEAVKKDCEAGYMAQDNNFHRGVFARDVTDEYSGESYVDHRNNLYVAIEGKEGAWDVRVYPDCVNTMNWLKEREQIVFDVYPDAIVLP